MSAMPWSLYVMSPMVVPGKVPLKTSSLTAPGSVDPALSMAVARICTAA